MDLEKARNKNIVANKETILNNLLDIKGRDSAIYTRVTSTSTFDVHSKFGKDVTQTMIDEQEWEVELKESDLIDIIDKVKGLDDAKSIIKVFDDNKIRIFIAEKKALAEGDIANTKKVILKRLSQRLDRATQRWNSYISKAKDQNIIENVWPIHAGMLFVSVRFGDKRVYAPLLLRQVVLKIDGDKLTARARGDWFLNEKLVFIINQDRKTPLKDKIFFDDMSGKEAIETILKEYGWPGLKTYNEEFMNIDKDSIKNTDIDLHPGVVLGFFKPSGGNLRKTMMKIIDNDEHDKIINEGTDWGQALSDIEEFILNPDKNIYKVRVSNYSQDKAVISSLLQDTIIWGPPGTGKSQTIANIISNIMITGKTGVIMSQKKAALSVLRKRLGLLAKYALFILTDAKLERKHFYKPVNEFIEAVSAPNLKDIVIEHTPVISQAELESIEVLNEAKNKGVYDQTLRLVTKMSQSTGRNFEVAARHLFNLKSNRHYPLGSEAANMTKAQMEKYMIDNSPSRIATKGEDILTDFETVRDSLVALAGLGIANANRYTKYMVEGVELNRLVQLNKATTRLVHKVLNIDDEKVIDQNFAYKLSQKIQGWRQSNPEIYKKYEQFVEDAKKAEQVPRNFLDDHEEIVRLLFPVVITTPETSFIKWEKDSFDYSILDEASQIFLEVGLPILYLGKIKIMSGDIEQMKPSRWFSSRDKANEEDKDDEVNDAEHFDDADSILEYGLSKGLYSILLDKNYRSRNAALMSFSSKEFYDSKLDVMDVVNNEINPIEVINVDGTWDGGRNDVEAEVVLEQAEKGLSEFETVIILTFNSKQKIHLLDEIVNFHPRLWRAIESRKLSLRNIENIQGDEADLVICSVVYDPTTNMNVTYVARSGGRNSLNVAISRAKEKMIVVKSITSETVKEAKNADYVTFKKWLEFLDMDPAEQKMYSSIEVQNERDETVETPLTTFDDDVLASVATYVINNNAYKLKKHMDVGSIRIDVAIINARTGKFIMGIETDKFDYYGNNAFDQYLSDVAREEFLETKGYKIFRIREVDWLTSKQEVLDNLAAALSGQGSKK